MAFNNLEPQERNEVVWDLITVGCLIVMTFVIAIVLHVLGIIDVPSFRR